jgi:hypothetical protein
MMQNNQRTRYNKSEFSTSLLQKVFGEMFYNRTPTDKPVTLHVSIPEKDEERFLSDPAKYLFEPLNLPDDEETI